VLVTTRILLIGATALATLAVAVTPAGGAKNLFRPCSGSFSTRGVPGGGDYGNIETKRVTCFTARFVTRAWIVGHGPAQADTDSTGKDNEKDPSTDNEDDSGIVFRDVIKGYTCAGKPAGKKVNVVCAHDGGQYAVRFDGGA
jgi:hypothetical protein